MERNQKLEIVMDSNINYFNLNCCRILILGSNSQIQDLVDIIVEAKKWHGFDCEIFVDNDEIKSTCNCVQRLTSLKEEYDIAVISKGENVNAKKIIYTTKDDVCKNIIEKIVNP